MAARSPGVILEARGLHHAFGAAPVLRGVDVTVAEGEVVGLVGPNGSGKSTALGILHHALVPDAGHVRLEGRDLRDLSARERARSIAVMTQEQTGEVPLTVADVVLLGRIPHAGTFGARTDEDLEIAVDALTRTGALHLARREFSALSGGEKQRVLIACALAQRPKLLLLDEPTNHLDIGAQHEVLQMVRDRHRATVIVLHDLNLAARYCDRVLVLDDGLVQADGRPAEALDPDRIAAVYGVAVERVVAADGTSQFLFRQGPDVSSVPSLLPSAPGRSTERGGHSG